MLTLYVGNLIAFAWVIFLFYWWISARNVKKVLHREKPWVRYIGGLVAIALVILAALPGTGPIFRMRAIPESVTVDVLAVVFVYVGVAFAIWARRNLGRNWSAEPSLQEDHELVTSGPYHYVRHPIYAGILLALLGTALATSVAWALGILVFAYILVRRVGVEEEIMTKQFPDKYPQYRKTTKALIPFLW